MVPKNFRMAGKAYAEMHMLANVPTPDKIAPNGVFQPGNDPSTNACARDYGLRNDHFFLNVVIPPPAPMLNQAKALGQTTSGAREQMVRV